MAKKKASKSVPKTKALAVVADNGGLNVYSEDVATILHRKTPKEFVAKHPFNGLDYVEIGYMRRCVEDFCKKIGATWSFEAEDVGAIETLLKAKQVVVRGRLIIAMKDGTVMVRENFGGSEVKCFKDSHRTKPGQPMDLGNDYKAATSDAFKKCASSFGIAQDVYEPKVEAKVNAYNDSHNSSAEVGTEDAPSCEEPEFAPGVPEVRDPSARISMEKVATLSKLIHKNGLADEADALMRKEFGHTLVSKLTDEQHKVVLDFVLSKNPQEEPF